MVTLLSDNQSDAGDAPVCRGCACEARGPILQQKKPFCPITCFPESVIQLLPSNHFPFDYNVCFWLSLEGQESGGVACSMGITKCLALKSL